MKFTVTFKTKGNLATIDIEPCQIGTDGVDLIRKELATPRLPLELIKGYSPKFYEYPEITLPEEVARRSRKFQNCNTITVCVLGNLNSFTKLDVVSEKEDNGAISRAYLRRTVCYDDIISKWEAAGFPTEWEIE